MGDMSGYESKVCVVTGAALDMCCATAELLVALGATVYAMDINPVDVPGITECIPADLPTRIPLTPLSTGSPPKSSIISAWLACAAPPSPS